MTSLTPSQRRTVLEKVLTLVDTKFSGADVDLRQLRDVHEARVLNSVTHDELRAGARRLAAGSEDQPHAVFFTKRGHVLPDGSRWPPR